MIKAPRLGEINVHLFKIITGSAQQIQWLSGPEERRAKDFAIPELGQKFRARRIILRELLASYLDVSPWDLRIDVGEHGKPSLTLRHETLDLRFNMSDSQDWLAIAISQSAETGIDIEVPRSVNDFRKIATRYFSKSDIKAMDATDEGIALHRFFQLWCRKEALGKANGGGISLGLRNNNLQDEGDPNLGQTVVIADRPFWVCNLEANVNLIGAIALETPITSVIVTAHH